MFIDEIVCLMTLAPWGDLFVLRLTLHSSGALVHQSNARYKHRAPPEQRHGTLRCH